MFLRWVDGKAQVADALTKLHGDGDLSRAVCRQAFTVLVEAPEIMAARRQEKREREKVPRVKSPSKLRELVDEMSMLVTTTTTVTWHEPRSHPVVFSRHPAIGSRTSLRDQCLFLPLYTLLRSFVARSALAPLQSVAVPETVLSIDSLPVPLQTDRHPVCARLFTCSLVLNTPTVWSSSAGGTFTITVAAERCPLVEGHSVHWEGERWTWGWRICGMACIWTHQTEQWHTTRVHWYQAERVQKLLWGVSFLLLGAAHYSLSLVSGAVLTSWVVLLSPPSLEWRCLSPFHIQLDDVTKINKAKLDQIQVQWGTVYESKLAVRPPPFGCCFFLLPFGWCCFRWFLWVSSSFLFWVVLPFPFWKTWNEIESYHVTFCHKLELHHNWNKVL